MTFAEAVTEGNGAAMRIRARKSCSIFQPLNALSRNPNTPPLEGRGRVVRRTASDRVTGWNPLFLEKGEGAGGMEEKAPLSLALSKKLNHFNRTPTETTRKETL